MCKISCGAGGYFVLHIFLIEVIWVRTLRILVVVVMVAERQRKRLGTTGRYIVFSVVVKTQYRDKRKISEMDKTMSRAMLGMDDKRSEEKG